MFCMFCGAENEDDAAFCYECGQPLESPIGDAQQYEQSTYTSSTHSYNGNSNSYQGNSGDTSYSYGDRNRANTNARSGRYDVNADSPELREIFIDTDEKLIAKLGNGFLINLLVNKRVKRCFGLLSNKRVYLKGQFYSTGGGKVNEVSCMQILDVEDITGTGFIYSAFPLIYVLLAAVAIALGALAGVLLGGRADAFLVTMFFGVVAAAISLVIGVIKSRQTQFFIEYAGGRIKFDASTIGLRDVQDFQKQIRRVKDKVIGKI